MGIERSYVLLIFTSIILFAGPLVSNSSFAQSQIIPSSSDTSVSPSTPERRSQSPLTNSNVIVTFVGKVDVSKLPQLSESAEVFTTFEKPFLTKDFSYYNQMKSQIPVNIPQNNFIESQPQMGLVERQLTSAQSPESQNPFTLLTAFEGLNRATSGGFIPPDTQVAAGPNHIMELVNVHAKIWNKQGVPQNDFSLQSFFLYPPGIDPGDPKILYDSSSGRWFASAFVSGTHPINDRSTVRIAISVTNDPDGNWFIYEIKSDSNLCPDQPKIGISDDKFVVSVNKFSNFCGAGSSFQGVKILVFKKSDLLSGSTVPFEVFEENCPNCSRFGIYPAQSMSSSSTIYLGSIDDFVENVVTFYTITGTVPGTTLITVEIPIATSITPPNAIQAGSAFLINTGDNRVQDADWRQGKLWLALHDSCIPPGDTITRSCARFIQINTATPAVTQDFLLGANGFYYFYPDLSIDIFEGIGIVFGF